MDEDKYIVIAWEETFAQWFVSEQLPYNEANAMVRFFILSEKHTHITLTKVVPLVLAEA